MHFVPGNSGGCFETCRFLCSSMHTCLLHTHTHRKPWIFSAGLYYHAETSIGRRAKSLVTTKGLTSRDGNLILIYFFMENPVQTAEDGEGPHRTLRERCGKPEVQSLKCI